ncbi:MAG: protein kinase [Polyangiaceae bacterium]
MRPKEILAERFEILARAGSGGMGTVYRALDQHTREPVAVKVLDRSDADAFERFRREARALSLLAHPGIVRYVDAGLTERREPYLVMEWLEGEDLSARLGREGVDAAGALALAKRLLSALAYAHGEGVIHRDVKPSNILLLRGEPAHAKLVDFGIARFDTATRMMTTTGAILGSVGYMAPEQARGERSIGPRSDLFSLGCVLFECLAGRPPFVGTHPISILVQSLHDRPPLLAELRPDLPSAITGTVDRMLSRSPNDRPERAADVLALLEGAGELPGGLSGLRPPARAAMSDHERRMVSVILVRHADVSTITVSDDVPTMIAADTELALVPLRHAVESLGGHVVQIKPGIHLVVLEGRAAAQDEAAQAGTCALAIHAALPHAHVAVATGPGEMTGRWAAGPVVDRAMALLDMTRPANERLSAEIRVDEVTAGLLDVRFAVRYDGPLRLLVGARSFAGESRKVLGKPTPCVGRERELAFLEATYAGVAGDMEARGVLAVAGAGVGKSRLQREIAARLSARGAEILFARCDVSFAGSAHHAASELVRCAAGIREDGTAEARRAALEAYVERTLPAPARERAKDFLGEIVRAPSAREPGPLLRAARNDPRVMAEQVREVFEAWLAELTRERPLFIVLEDVHWSDASSARIIESAVLGLAERPLFVLALARPEVRQMTPRPFATFAELSIEPLSKRASEKLVRAVLGDEADPATVERVVQRAGGNAFYLEELIRHVAAHGDGSMPETVLAMARSRLDALEPQARRILRVASVLGEQIWESGVTHLLGGSRTSESVGEWLETLVAREILEPGQRQRFAGEKDYTFRHALLREAAYATLTEEDQKVGHRLAAEWLERIGERDPQVIAEHLLCAGEPARAAPYLLKVAQARMDGGDLEGADAAASKGLACDPAGAVRGRLLVAVAMARGFQSSFDRAEGAAREALDLLDPGSVPWFQSAGIVVLAGAVSGSPGAMLDLLSRLSQLQSTPEPSQPYAFTAFMLVTALVQLGQKDMALAVGARLEAVPPSAAGLDPAFAGFRDLVRATLADKAKIDRLDEVLAFSDTALTALRACGDRLGEAIAAGWRARALELTGDFCEAEKLAREVLDLTERTANAMTHKRASCVLGAALVGLGRHDEAIAVLSSVPDSDRMAHLLARVHLARAHLHRGDPATALREAEATADAAGFFAPHKASALGVVAAARLALADPAGALAAAREGRALAASAGADVWTVSLLRLAEIEALTAAGEAVLAGPLAAEAASRLRAVAATLGDRAASFLAVREHARTLALAPASNTA